MGNSTSWEALNYEANNSARQWLLVNRFNKNQSNSGRNRTRGTAICNDVLPVLKNKWGTSAIRRPTHWHAPLHPCYSSNQALLLLRPYADLGTLSEITAILSVTLTGFSLTDAGRLLLQQSATIRQAPSRRQTF